MKQNGRRSETQIRIDNLRGHPAEVVDQLRSALRNCSWPGLGRNGKEGANGLVLSGDPRRRGFYELETCDRVFYFAVSPRTGTIFLLATWPRRAAPGRKSPESARLRPMQKLVPEVLPG